MPGPIGPIPCEPTMTTLAGRRCFVGRWRPSGATRGAVMLVQPFGDEAHLSRRTHRLVAERLASRGIEVWQPDLSGTGDSEGDLVDVSIGQWRAELEALADLLGAAGHAGIVVGGRFGARLAVDLIESRPQWVRRAVLWSPLLDGGLLLTGYFRSLSVGGGRDGGVSSAAEARAAWAAGQPVRIAGLDFGATLGRELGETKATAPTHRREMLLIDVRGVPEDELLEPGPGLVRTAGAWRDAGALVRVDAVRGPAFWNVPDPVDCTALIDRIEAEVGAEWP
jgi:exosortase A-associated hydrolase 2